tara:strand:+ start:5571 stop:6872 length:1302 start_codon:yes stop_codon:yes gene_type:complete
MAIDKQINNDGEYDLDRGEVVWNNRSGSMVFDNTTGKERLHLSHFSGANLSFNNKAISVFAPNNSQEMVNGSKYSTSVGDSFEQVRKNKEQRVFGDLNMITGSPNFFTEPIAENWIESNRQLATSKTGPERNYGGVGNNSGAAFPVDGTPNSTTGVVDGGSYSQNEAQSTVQQQLEDQTEVNTEIESGMGVGGNINLLSCKHILLQAGTSTANYDSGLVVPNARAVTQRYDFNSDTGKVDEVRGGVSVYESKDTSSAIPFGDIHISAGTKLKMQSGSGGVDINTAGDMGINSTGRVSIGGAEVSIGSGTGGLSAGRVTIVTENDLFFESDAVITNHAPCINTIADTQNTLISPLTLMTNDCHVQGDLRVQGNLYVEGDITCNGSTGITVPRGDVVVAGTVGGTVVSLQEVEDALNSLDRSALVVTVTPEDEED